MRPAWWTSLPPLISGGCQGQPWPRLVTCQTHVDVDGGKKLEKIPYLTSKDNSIFSLGLKIFCCLI
jgi:hypothetical protein